MQGAVSVGDRPDGPGARFRFEAVFEAATGVPERGIPLTGHAVAVVSPDPFVSAAATAASHACGGENPYIRTPGPYVPQIRNVRSVYKLIRAAGPPKGRGLMDWSPCGPCVDSIRAGEGVKYETGVMSTIFPFPAGRRKR